MHEIERHMSEGDIITITGVPGRWRVCETTTTASTGRVRLRPVDNPFNDAAGDYWIVWDIAADTPSACGSARQAQGDLPF